MGRQSEPNVIAIGGASWNITFATKSKMRPKLCRHWTSCLSETASVLSLLVGTHQRHRKSTRLTDTTAACWLAHWMVFPQCLLAATFQIANVRANGGSSTNCLFHLTGRNTELSLKYTPSASVKSENVDGEVSSLALSLPSNISLVLAGWSSSCNTRSLAPVAT